MTKGQQFASLHLKGEPLVLYNIWDAGGARAVVDAGAKAVATGSWSVASAHGFDDGEAIPLDYLEMIVRRIAASVTAPVTIDFEGGYHADPGVVAANVARMIDAGAVGINFEDQIVGGSGLYAIDAQAARIAAIRAMANGRGADFFINARTDVFLKAPDKATHAALAPEAIKRAHAYRDAGASGFFAPGLADEALIRALCAASPLPVNIMTGDGAPPIARLAALGVARVSHGPFPYIAALARFRDAAARAIKGEVAGRAALRQ